MQKEVQLLRAPSSVGRYKKKMLNYSRDKHEGTYCCSGEGGEGPLCDPGSELLLGGSTRESSAMNKKKETANSMWLLTLCSMIVCG